MWPYFLMGDYSYEFDYSSASTSGDEYEREVSLERKLLRKLSMSVRDYYKYRTILVTGGTGFMGKVLIEKLLFHVPDIQTIYVLIRPKKGCSAQQRLERMFELPLFERLRKQRAHVLPKIKALNGDVLQENFGLSDPDIEKLEEEVSVVFHFAATLRLEAPLRDNVNMNTCGTLRAINLARKFKKLAIFVHLSTAFCYPDYDVLEERTFPPSVNTENVLGLLEWLDDKQLELLTPSLLGPHPNCYTFSKRLAEDIVQKAYPDLPLVITRPSIVCPSLNDPVAGWVDNLNGPVGLMLAAGKGVIRTMLCDGSLYAQVIPVDTAISAILAIGMFEGSRTEKHAKVPVYNLNIGHQKPTTWSFVLDAAKEYARKNPLSWPLWYPNGDITTNKNLHEFKRICFQVVPAYMIDAILFLTGQKRFMVRIQNRISKGLEVLQYFTTRPWCFASDNYDSIEVRLSSEERKIFSTNLVGFERKEYMITSVEGGRKFCLKEDPAQIARNRHYHNFLYVLDWIVKLAFFYFLACIVYRILFSQDSVLERLEQKLMAYLTNTLNPEESRNITK